MSPCEEYSIQILSYVGGRLQGEELGDFRAHLDRCPDCRAKLEAEQSLSQLLRRSRPLYSAPAELRAHVAATVEQHAQARSGAAFYERFLRMLESGFTDPVRRVARLRQLAVSLAVMVLILAFLPNVVRRARAASYVETAVATHRNYLDGSLSLELHSNSPVQVSEWFASKVRFPFRLPKAQVTSDSQPAYQLTGASVVQYRGKPAAFVTYQKRNEKISLLAVPSDSAVVAGGDEIRSGNLTFHYRTDQGFNVVTWSTHGFSYALVSSISGPARASCMVCHQSMADHGNFRSGH